MPRFAELRELTPFAMVLVNFMWNRRKAGERPLTTAQLAVRLGVTRQSVNNWIYIGNVPPIETVLAILAKLDIPMRELYDAYKLSGLPVPRWDEADTDEPQPGSRGASIAERTKKATTLPASEALPLLSALSPSSASTASTARSQSRSEASRSPAPRPYTPPPATNPADEQSAEWERLIAQTADALRAEGMSETSIEAVIASLRARQTEPAGARAFQRHQLAEHAEHAEHTAPDTSGAPNTSDSSATAVPKGTNAPRAGHPRRTW